MKIYNRISESHPFYKSDNFNQGGNFDYPIDDFSKISILHDVGLAVTQMLDLEKILDFAVDILVNKLGIEECLIYLWNEELERYVLRHQHGVAKKTQDLIEKRRLSGTDLVKQIADTKNAIYIPVLGEDDRFKTSFNQEHANNYYLGFPLISRNIVIGVIELISPVLENKKDIDISFFTTLGRSIGVAIDNSMLVSQIQEQRQVAISLFELSTKITSTLSLKEVLGEIAYVAKTILKSDIGMVGLYQSSCDEIKIWAASGENAEKLEGMIINVAEGSPGNILAHGQEFIGNIKEGNEINLHKNSVFQDNQIKSYLAVPLHRGDTFIGLIEVMDRKERKYSNNDILLLRQLGYHVFVAVDDAHLHEQLRYGATLEEQNRLARELHDHLAQAMGFIKIKAIMAKDQLSKGEQGKAVEHIDELVNTTSVLYTDLREAIFNLRNTEADQENFLTQLQDYLTEYEQYYGLEVRLSVDDHTTTEFTPEVANQLIRIIQEALSNVRRHACAQHVWIKFQQVGSEISICIEDDGSGFDPLEVSEQAKPNQSFGLQIMCERIQCIEGKLDIISCPGKGTKICIQVPSVFIR